ncbi:zinc finger protein 892-like [Diachasmimorpha longicaudata]|uniref:zinc finger protein 892-like n=1 Tax=Diachasmimorpha longicaudata TaxID=58733 RepID=UPI0030B91571
MNFTEVHGVQGLPQFSELTSRPNSVSSSGYPGSLALQSGGQNSVYTTAAGSDHGKQHSLTNGSTKYPGSLLPWPNPNALMQLCEKQGLQPLNIPSYSQNNSLLSTQPSVSSLRLLPNMYLPPTPQSDSPTIKQEDMRSNDSGNPPTDSPHIQQHSATMAEYLQKLQATSLPLTLQQIIKLQTDPIKREDYKEEKSEHSQNNILNIPSVPNFRNNSSQNGNYMSSDQMMPEINPIDLNVHMDEHESAQGGHQNVPQGQNIKVEQQVQTDSPKVEKKMKFRAKVGEIKIAMALDGSMLYCCPECTLAFAEKTDIEQHIQGHVQERKYQCKECGAMLKRKEHLDQHMRGHSDERPFKCPVCQKAFKRNEHLTRHYVIHSGDKNFTCTVCQKAFSRKDHLNKHTQTHLGIRKSKSKKESGISDLPKDSTDTIMDIPKQELSFLLKDGNFMKQDSTFLQHIQNLQKDQNFIHTYSAFKEQMKEGIHQQQAVNMNEILPQNTRYLMPS